MTLREGIFSVLIVGVLYAVGFLCAGSIEKHISEKTLQYRQAAQIKDNGPALSHACDTDLGNAFVEGDFAAIDPVAMDGLEGEHLSIVCDRERYTMHTRVVTYTVPGPKGTVHTRTRIQTYWTWDRISRKSAFSKEISLCGNTYPADTFDFRQIPHSSKIRGVGFNLRDVYTFQPSRFRGAFYARLNDGTINGKPLVHNNTSIEAIYKDFTTSHAVTIFWIIWWILTAVIVAFFAAIDNRWLEES